MKLASSFQSSMSVTATSTSTEPQTLPVQVYSPESSLRHPLQLVREIAVDLWQCRELTWTLFLRDLKSQFRQSLLRYVWLFVPIIATTLIWVFMTSMNVVQVTGTGVPYAAYVLTGSLIWGVFAAAVVQPLTSFHESQAVIMRLKVTPEAFILSGAGRIVFELLIKLLVVIPVLAMLGVMPASTAWLFPLGMLCTVLIGLSIGCLLIPIGSLYTDISRALTTLLPFLMYLTPVVYPLPKEGWTAAIIRSNPLTSMVMACRDWLVIGPSDFTTALLATTAVALLALGFSLMIFRAVLPHLVERMGM